jgi:hypothetical protein
MRQFFSETITIGLEEIIGKDLDEFLDFISVEAGETLLHEISYAVVGSKEGNIVLRVNGYVYAEE